MKHSGAPLFPIAVMALLAAGAFWLDRATQVADGGRDGRHRHDPDYIVDNFNVRRFDESGKLQHLLVAQKMLHYPDDDSTEVIAPRLTYYHTPPVHIFSNTAWLDKDGKHVRLDGDVRVVRDGRDGNPPTEIATSVLYAVPDDDFAHTDAPVVITQGQTVMRGSGMESNNKSQISILYGRASGTIYQKQANQADAAHEKK
ncbi:MAG: LPS export ABC transporter periplasmic protein LptC [Rhodocyclaceae bacterium]|nr:LPS export ABC transporter periplasmic protein LptC [Rhodocyclaceae bacterium]